ncbi:alpha/beta hydrolase [Thermobifida halotolerans]|uniref:Alpha/beta hydrolase n=1 Tax=Thermobifida halotolerans TaxID=483545 RepID=A0A399G768_9ACTN|nr:alpha/beta hydrolase [Thermobifida halotolerans]UOE20700.1 alpha/beta hydrolase [Thermobifida halotolerans]
MTTPMDPAIAALAATAAAAAAPPLHTISPAEARARVVAGHGACSGGPALHSVTDIRVPVADAEIGARVYSPAAGPTRATLVYLHGGGWVTGDLDYCDELCRFVADRLDWTVVSVDYRLAPEHPFPTPLDDAYAVLGHVADTIAGDGPLGVGGDSAGGNLAAACALRARDEHGPALDFQVLVYPVTDHDLTRDSYRTHADAFPIGAESMRWFWDHYLPDAARRDLPAASPLRAVDVGGLPPAHVVVAGHDPLHDEGVAYAERLREAGVRVSLAEYPSLTHGFFRLTGAVPAARAAVDDLVAALRDLLARSS